MSSPFFHVLTHADSASDRIHLLPVRAGCEKRPAAGVSGPRPSQTDPCDYLPELRLHVKVLPLGPPIRPSGLWISLLGRPPQPMLLLPGRRDRSFDLPRPTVSYATRRRFWAATRSLLAFFANCGLIYRRLNPSARLKIKKMGALAPRVFTQKQAALPPGAARRTQDYRDGFDPAEGRRREGGAAGQMPPPRSCRPHSFFMPHSQGHLPARPSRCGITGMWQRRQLITPNRSPNSLTWS